MWCLGTYPTNLPASRVCISVLVVCEYVCACICVYRYTYVSGGRFDRKYEVPRPWGLTLSSLQLPVFDKTLSGTKAGLVSCTTFVEEWSVTTTP